MKRKVFKYKIIGILIFLIELFIFALFTYGSYDSFIDFNLSQIFIVQNFIFIFAVLVASTAFLNLILILLSAKKSIFFLNIQYSIIFLFFASGFVKMLLGNDYYKEDNIKFIIVFSLIFILLFVINFFKYKSVEFSEIEEIGTRNN
ncbi:hypothetical protein SAMN05421856_10287 [Chryseobacterium taichungense]|uniref:Uncharacterized protein n=1 Tax=Chryseobacterium taichungense TaxID=295069 RepID=A0A1H7WYK5_9FLAO|nr:hypothetical protein [Chryseobacterium taichungense]SEM26650.1 hypothetical protein SAMN05421856_10287 [Chryseobacterium taichungense]